MASSFPAPVYPEAPSRDPGVTIHAAPPLSLDGYPQASKREVQRAENDQDRQRLYYWSEGDGARVFLEEMARQLNASPHMAHRPFEIVMSTAMKRRIHDIVNKRREYAGNYVEQDVLNYADEAATVFLGNLVRRRQWEENWLPNKMPLPFRRPTYTGGQSARGTALSNAFMPRISDEVSREEYSRWVLENNLL
jgi:hypothetical protein